MASSLRFWAYAGTNYYLAVKGFLGLTGDVVLNIWHGGFPPRFFTQPESATATPGSDVSLMIRLIGRSMSTWPDPPWSFQWNKNGTQIAGATTSTLTVTNVQQTDAGEYSLLVSNSFGSVLSSNATLSVVPVWITSQPQSLLISTGYTATFSVTGSGPTPLSYQWLKDGIQLESATADTLTLTNVTFADAGEYRVEFADALTNVVSSNATLQVITPYTFVTLAGRNGWWGGEDGVGAAARFKQPHGITVDERGYLYVTEVGNSTIRQISPGGMVTTIAGLAGTVGTNDGPGWFARFRTPYGIAVDRWGSLFVADSGNRYHSKDFLTRGRGDVGRCAGCDG